MKTEIYSFSHGWQTLPFDLCLSFRISEVLIRILLSCCRGESEKYMYVRDGQWYEISLHLTIGQVSVSIFVIK